MAKIASTPLAVATGLALLAGLAGFVFWLAAPLGRQPLPPEGAAAAQGLTAKPMPMPIITEPTEPPPTPVERPGQSDSDTPYVPPTRPPGT